MTATRAANDRFLLRLLKGADLPQELAIGRDDAAWEDLLALLRQHRLLGFAGFALTACTALLPPRVANQLRRSCMQSLVVNAAVESDGERVLRALLERDIAAAPLKGPWLAEHVGLHPAQRLTGDIDVLVPEESRYRAATTLGELGYHDVSERQDAVRPFHSLFQPIDERPMTPVELHTAMVGSDSSAWMDGLWGRAARQSWHGQEIWGLSPTDCVLVTAVHACRHQWAHLSQVLDVALTMRAEEGQIDWDLLAAQAREAGIASAVGRSLALAGSLCAVEAPPTAIRALQQGSVRRLFGDALLSRRGVVRPRPKLLAGPYSTLLNLAADDDRARRRRVAWRRLWRPDVGAHGSGLSRARWPIRKAGRLCVQGIVALTPTEVDDLLVGPDGAGSPR